MGGVARGIQEELPAIRGSTDILPPLETGSQGVDEAGLESAEICLPLSLLSEC